MRAIGDAEMAIAKRKSTREATQLEHRGALALEIIADDMTSASRRGYKRFEFSSQLRRYDTLGAFWQMILGATRAFSSS